MIIVKVAVIYWFSGVCGCPARIIEFEKAFLKNIKGIFSTGGNNPFLYFFLDLM